MRQFFVLAVATALARVAFAQGGPPMITDDPGTPGAGHWENNLAISFEHRSNEWALDAPGIDLNYGWGDHVQLTLQTSAAWLKRGDHGAIVGPGGVEAAVKWRFFDEENFGVDLSMFPRVLFNVTQSSVRRGLAEPGTRFQIPFEAAKTLGPIVLDVEFGPLINSTDRGEFLSGLVVARDLSKTNAIMAEVHATSRMNLTRAVITLNFGWRHTLNEHSIVIASVGHEVHSDANEPLALIGYCGVQLVY